MSEQSGFFNANLVNGEYDRVYLAEHFAKYFANFISNGIFGGKSDELMVIQSANTGMKIEVSSGVGYINGFWYENDSNLSLDVSVADGVLHRIDNVVLRFGRAERKIWAEVIRGTPASNAIAPVLQRNSDYFELKLAEIYIKAGTTSITQAQIIDTRLNSDECGFVVGLLNQFDTTEFGKQLNGYISDYAAQYKTFLEELELNNTRELESIFAKLNALANDESALTTLALQTADIASELAITRQTLGFEKKNLIPYPFAQTTRPINGITFTDNGDGTITVNGTATQDAYFLIYKGKAPGLGKYLVNSGIDTMQKHFAYMRFVDKESGAEIVGTTRLGYDSSPLDITKEYADKYDFFVGLCVYKGIQVSNLVFKPMVRMAEILDNTWEPYVQSTNELLSIPNKPGIEYLLGERWNDKPVYQKTVHYLIIR